MCACGMRGITGSFAHSCRESEWKSPLYRMKASEDYPLTMKCDDPPSTSDTKRVQPNIALGTKPWSLLCEKTSECVLVIRRVSLPFFCRIKHLPHSSSFYIADWIFLNCILSDTNSVRGWMTRGSCEGLFPYISLLLITEWITGFLVEWGVHLNMNVCVKKWCCVGLSHLCKVFVHMCLCV